MKTKVFTILLIAASILSIGAAVQQYDQIGQVVSTTAVFDPDTGKVIIVPPLKVKLTGEDIYWQLPDGVLTDNPYGLLSHPLPTVYYDYIVGVTVKQDIDDDDILIPWFDFVRLKSTYDSSPYQYDIGSQIFVKKVVDDGVIIDEVFTGIVTGHTHTTLANGTIIPVWTVKYKNYSNVAARKTAIYSDTEELVPAKQ